MLAEHSLQRSWRQLGLPPSSSSARTSPTSSYPPSPRHPPSLSPQHKLPRLGCGTNHRMQSAAHQSPKARFVWHSQNSPAHSGCAPVCSPIKFNVGTAHLDSDQRGQSSAARVSGQVRQCLGQVLMFGDSAGPPLEASGTACGHKGRWHMWCVHHTWAFGPCGVRQVVCSSCG